MGRQGQLWSFPAPLLGGGPVPDPRLRPRTELGAVTPQAETCQAPPLARGSPRTGPSFTLPLTTWEALRMASCQGTRARRHLSRVGQAGAPMAPTNVPQGKGRGADREDEDAGAPGQGVPASRAAPPPPPVSLSAPGAPRGRTSGVEDEAGLSPTRPLRRRGLLPSSVLLVPGPHGGPGSLWVPLLFCYTDTPPL